MKVLLILALVIASVAACDKPQRQLINPRDIPAVTPIKARLTNGFRAFEGQFPYEVALKCDNKVLCAGAIISNQWVLTAAHCTDGFSFVIVGYGSTLLRSPKLAVTVGREHFKQHPGYNKMTGHANDISLIQTPPVTFDFFIKKIVLPPIASSYPTYVGEKTIVAGWGKSSDTGSVVNDLQYANFDIITNEVCQRRHKSIIISSMMCVATPSKRSPCNGDSGAPMVMTATKQMVGLVSFGSKSGCEIGIAVVFTRITSYLNWIKDVSGVYY